MEKAYAKVHSNYEMISSGAQAEAARFLTGAPAREFTTNSQTVEDTWDVIHAATQSDYIVTAVCDVEHNGLLPGYGYVIKNSVEMKNKDGTNLRFVKIKNPWKETENTKKKGWTGAFSQKDKFWTNENKEKVSFNELQKGEFLIAVEDFKESFKSYTIAYLNEDWKNSFIEKRNAVNKKAYKFNFTISESHLSASTEDVEVEAEEGEEVEEAPKGKSRPADASNLLIGVDIADDGEADEEEDEDDEMQAAYDTDDGNQKDEEDDSLE